MIPRIENFANTLSNLYKSLNDFKNYAEMQKLNPKRNTVHVRFRKFLLKLIKKGVFTKVLDIP